MFGGNRRNFKDAALQGNSYQIKEGVRSRWKRSGA
jgi:hypothetical protein